jgi:hypothetical protein
MRVQAVSAYTVTITSSPITGPGFVNVDGTDYATPATFSWATGETHNLIAKSPVLNVSTQYVYTGWSDGGTQTHSYTVVGTATVTANYKTQYHLTVSSYSGLVPAPTPASGWFDAGSQVTLTAPQAGHDPQGTFYTFHGVWSVNGVDIKGNTLQITMNSPTVAIAWYVDPPEFGDVNNDGKVDLADLILVALHYGTVLGGPGYSYLYDINGDGRIDLIDLAAVATAIQP